MSGGNIHLSPDTKNLHTPRKPGILLPGRWNRLLTDAQLGNDCTVTLDVLLGNVVEQAAALTNKFVHTKTAVVVIGVLLEVLGELADTLGEDCDLDFGGTGVTFVGGVGSHNFALFLFGNHVVFTFLNNSFSCGRGNGLKGTPSGASPESQARGLM